MHIATKANETNTKNKTFKTARCHCNRKVIIMYLPISKFLIFSTYSLDQAENVLSVTSFSIYHHILQKYF